MPASIYKPCGCVSDLAELRARIAALEARHGVRDEADAAVLMAVRDASCGLAFTTRDLWEGRQRDELLRVALEAADIDGPRQLGKLIARLVGHDVDGWRVTRDRQSRDGVLWQVTRIVYP